MVQKRSRVCRDMVVSNLTEQPTTLPTASLRSCMQNEASAHKLPWTEDQVPDWECSIGTLHAGNKERRKVAGCTGIANMED